MAMDQGINYSTGLEMDTEMEPTFSNKTITSPDDVLNVIDKDENVAFTELSAYYSQIIRNSKTARKNTANKVIVNSKNTKKLPNNLPSRYNTNKNQQVTNVHKKYNIEKYLPEKISKSIDNNIKCVETDSEYACCSKDFPGVELEQKLTFIRSKNKRDLLNTEVNTTRPASAEKTTNCRPAIDLERFILKCMNKNDPEKVSPYTKPAYAEKTTYCHPTVNMYSQEFIYKIMERNGRLRGLVRRLILAREREKQKESWDNFIKEIKTKHRTRTEAIPNKSIPCNVNPDVIDDFYNTRFVWKHSNPCQNLLQEYYGLSDEINTDFENYVKIPIKRDHHNFENKKISLPISSHARFMNLNKESHMNQVKSSRFRRYQGEPVLIAKEKQNEESTQSHQIIESILNNDILMKAVSLQTDLKASENQSIDDSKKESFKIQLSEVNSNVERLKQKISQTQKELTQSSLASIENKLDVLIKTINSFVFEIKTQRKNTVNETNETTQVSEFKSTPKNTTYGKQQKDHFVCELVQKKAKSTHKLDENRRADTIEDILSEEKYKSDKVKKDIEDILTKPACDRPSVHITFDIPTKERSTEITASLSKTRRSSTVIIQNRQMTIAVNTDPLGLLALFRVSAEAVKQILSYMPLISCGSYLPKLAITQMPRNETTHYVCHICGAAFCRPSQLRDHIQQHGVGNRDCGVCRHLLDSQRNHAGLFTCQHCGQVFTRAYCRQLHEDSCSRRPGRPLDATRSLVCLK